MAVIVQEPINLFYDIRIRQTNRIVMLCFTSRGAELFISTSGNRSITLRAVSLHHANVKNINDIGTDLKRLKRLCL